MSNPDSFTPPEEDKETKYAYETPLEKKIRAVLTPFEQFTQSQITASTFLLLCTLIALIWASIPQFQALYENFVNASIGFHISSFDVSQSFKFWVNDVLLTLFFFVIGLEIKREFLVGELVNRKRALLVLFAAIGGMALPACIYLALNYGLPTANGWGIPMATDTAFALGILNCFRNKLPKGIFTFMAALAIIDDIGAMLVISIMYTNKVNVSLLFIALILVGVLILFNYAGFRRFMPYFIVGILLWITIEAAGIHSTVAGVVLAFTIPARPRKGPVQFIRKAKELLGYFEKRKNETPLVLEDQKQHIILEQLKATAEEATTPLQRWESALELPIALLVLPIFALVNAGAPVKIPLLQNALVNPASLGIILGLTIGKPLGIILFTRIALWFDVAILPHGTQFKHIINIAFLGGIGFTMSLFMATLRFHHQTDLLLLSKAGILFGSVIAGTIGCVSLALTKPFKNKPSS